MINKLITLLYLFTLGDKKEGFRKSPYLHIWFSKCKREELTKGFYFTRDAIRSTKNRKGHNDICVSRKILKA